MISSMPDKTIASPRVVLVCYCSDPDRCHRAILRELILPKLGAVDAGEVERGVVT